MSIEKCKDFVKDGYGTWDDTSKPTTYANMYDFMKNQNNIVMNLASGIWQPSTSYVVGTIIRSPSLPAGCVATCTTAGTSGTTEPKWTAYGTTVTDGSCKWKVNTDSQDTMVGERNKAIDDLHAAITKETASAIKSAVDAAVADVTKTLSANMHAQYPVGSYIYSDKADNPATYLPYMSDTTWVQTAAGRVLIGAGTADSGTVYNAGDTGGEEKHKLSVEELARHAHPFYVGGYSGWPLRITVNPQRYVFSYDHSLNPTGAQYTGRVFEDTVYPTGGNVPHNNMEPYKIVYIFRRNA